jgi:hypothetical protein
MEAEERGTGGQGLKFTVDGGGYVISSKLYYFATEL